MIKVSYYPCIFEDKCYEFESHNETAITLLFSLFKKYPETREDSPEISIRVNGSVLHPVRWREPLKDGDRVFITQEMGYGVEWALGAIFGSAIYIGAGTVIPTAVIGSVLSVITTIASLAYTIYSFCAAPSAPKTGPGLNSSPTYGWDGSAMQSRQGVPVPVVYGEHKRGGNVCLTISP
jgi:hypothetical protein